MNFKKTIVTQILAGLGLVALSSSSVSQTDSSTPDQQFVTADPDDSQTVKAKSNTNAQPSTSNNKPPAKLSTALGLGPNSRIHIDGFFSAGAAWTNTSAYYLIPNRGTVDNHLSYAALSLIGLQFTADLARNLEIVTQFVGDGDDTNGNVSYRVNVEWAFLRYSLSDNHQIIVGRFRLPAFLYSQTQQVGYTYPWVMLPNEVYRIVPFNNVNGITFITRYPIGNSGWNFVVQPYYGSNKNTYTIYNNIFQDGIDVKFHEDDIAGIVIRVGNQNVTIRGAYAHLKLTAVYDGLAPIIPSTTLFSSSNTDFYSFGTKLLFGNVLVIGEYAKRSTPAQITALEGYYGSLGYKFGKLLPLFTYARLKTTNANQLVTNQALSEQAQDQQSYTLSLDYTLNSNLDIKGSISQITPLNGTLGLFSSNPNQKQIYLYGLSVDAIF